MSVSRHSRRILTIIKIIVIGLLSVILIGNLYLIAAQLSDKNQLPKIRGFAQIIVLSGSMQPDIQAGDLIIIKEQEEYKEGDIITYHSGRILITHRIIEISQSGIITKGDANNAADEPVEMSAVEGKVILILPGAGNLMILLKSPAGILVISCLVLLLYGASRMAQKLKREKKKE